MTASGTTGLAWRLALRGLRADIATGFSGFRIFLACLALGVAVIGGLGTISSAFKTGLQVNAANILGGDVQFSLPQRDLPPAVQAWLATQGSVSRARNLRAMARRDDGKATMLIGLKAVDGHYPLYGAVTLAPPMPLAQALDAKDGLPGIAADRRIVARLGLKLGDVIRLGTGRFTLRAVLDQLPDGSATLADLGPPALVGIDALKPAGLDQPGTIATHIWRLKLPPTAVPAQVIAAANRQFPGSGWRAVDADHASPFLGGVIDRLTTLLTLIGLAALLIGGMGVAQAIAAHLDRRTKSIAIMKALGAGSVLIRRIFLVEIMVLSCLGVALGLAAAATTPWLLEWAVGALLPIPLAAEIYPLNLAFAALCGLLSALSVTLWSLGGRFTLRDLSAATPLRQRLPALVPMAALAALVVAASPARRLTIEAAAAALAAMTVFLLLAAAVRWVARRAASNGAAGFRLRLALGNLHRPKSSAAPVMLGLGLGAAVLVAIGQIEGNFTKLTNDLQSGNAPSLFLIDTQPDQLAPFKDIAAKTPGISDLHTVPNLRTRVVRVNGVAIGQAHMSANAHRLIDGDRGLTYAATLPRGSRVVAGQWWPADYHGPPQVSMEDGLAEGLGLKLGDSITLNVAGRDIEARLSNLRHVDWTSLGINFFMIMSPGTLEPAPQTHLATLKAASQQAQDDLEQAIGAHFPNVSIIAVGDALDKVTSLIHSLASGLRAVAGVLLAAGLLVLGGASAATERRRLYDAVILKSLGATRGDLVRSYLIEYAILGLIAAMAAAGLGTLGAWIAVRQLLDLGWSLMAAPMAAVALGAVVVTVAIGFPDEVGRDLDQIAIALTAFDQCAAHGAFRRVGRDQHERAGILL
ncbi:MAG TPA: FtsX-like permease family protein, partial [Stellaceae bacterium]|nr:FtsX-like permease family protein [Stellaceae bacterium]